MNRRTISIGLSTACLAALGTTGALAQQSNSAEVDDLRTRVEQLEAANATITPRLTYNVSANTEITIYGFIRAEAFYDFDFDQGDLSLTGVIGEPAAATDGAFNTSVRVSRLGVRSKTQTDIGEIGTQLEVDLFGSGGTAEFRLRHANITIGDNWTFGQTWSNFMPIGQYPNTSDFNGPVGVAFARTPQVRYTGNISDQFQYSIAIEENFDGSSEDPMITAAAQYSTDVYTIRAAVLASQTVGDLGNDHDQTGLTLSGSVTPWEGGSIVATAVTGEGIGGFLIGGGANVVGGVVNDVDGFTVEFRQNIGDKWNVGIAYGNEDYDLPTTTATLDFVELETVHLNAFYSATDNLKFGLEYIRGERTTSAGTTFSADRIGASVTLNF